MSSSGNSDRSYLLNDCDRSIRYHQARARFLDSVHRWSQFFIFAFAMASVSDLASSLIGEDKFNMIWSALIGLLALLNFVFNPVEKAGLHRSLHRGFVMLAGEIDAAPNPNNITISHWKKTMHALFADEPPLYRALVAHCDNQVAIRLGVDKGHFVELNWYYRRFRNIFPFQGPKFPKRNQDV